METLKDGQPISLKLSDILKEFTTSDDIANVSTKTGVSISTLNYVKRRTNNVSKDNRKGIFLLAERAYQNAEQKRKEAMKSKKELKQILQNK